MTIDVLLITSYAAGEKFEVFWSRLARALSDRECTVSFISADHRLSQFLTDAGFHVYDLSKMPSELEPALDMAARAEKLLEQYSIPSLRDFVFPEKCYRDGREDLLISKSVRYFAAIEEFFSVHSVGCVVQRQGGEVIRRVTSRVAEHQHVPVIYLGDSFFPGRLFLYDNEMNELNLQLCSPGDLTESEMRKMDNYIHEFVQRRTLYQYHNTVNPSLREKTAKARWMIRKMGIASFIRSMVRFLKTKTKKGHQLMRASFRQLAFKVLFYSKFDPEAEYVFFPMHVKDDSQITLRNPHFYRQEFLVEVIARALPEGCRLYVKDHPGVNGYLSLSSAKFISRIKNVKLLDTGMHSHTVIQNAKAVVVINSTVGFEALHYYKPVIVLGNWWLKDLGCTIDVDNLFLLPSAIREAMRKKVDKDKIKALLYSLQREAFDGNVDINPYDIDYNGLAASLIEKLRQVS